MILVYHARKPISLNSDTNVLKHIRTSVTAILLITTLTITVTTSIQLVFAPRGCSGCGPFLELTAQFERDVGQSILEFAVENYPNNYLEFRQLTGQFKSDVINAVLQNPPEPDRIFGLLNSYDDGVERIFSGGPDTIPELLHDYGRNVFEIFGLGPR